MVYTWYSVRFKVHISIADVAKDTSFHCFENVRVSDDENMWQKMEVPV